MLLSQFIPASPSPLCPQVHSASASLSLPCKQVPYTFLFDFTVTLGSTCHEAPAFHWRQRLRAVLTMHSPQTRGEPEGSSSPDLSLIPPEPESHLAFLLFHPKLLVRERQPKKEILCISIYIAVLFCRAIFTWQPKLRNS